ncbi:Type I Iterative PKS [Elasticomyces elasticus]|nr:Type I Iterative PKS [Elasticomyces elasticus]KAK4967786.1 hypothetical protein LTR42_010113 [Elasticomyces elasticus]
MANVGQLRPSMPPTAGTVPGRRLVVFGDLTIAFKDDLTRQLHLKNATLTDFFDHSAFALKEEIGFLPADEQQLFPRFTTLVDLVDNLDTTAGAPAVRFALLCVYQLGRWILNCTESSDAYPRPDNTYLLGLCTGTFAASVVAASRTVAELLLAGIQAVRCAFRTATLSLRVGRDVESSSSITPVSWAFLTHQSKVGATALIEAFTGEEALPITSRPYLSACSLSNVTISGPPSVLKQLAVSKNLKTHPLPIQTPFHAPHLFGEDDVADVVGDLQGSPTAAYQQRLSILSAATGEAIVEKSFHDLLRLAVHGTLRSLIEWDEVISSCAHRLAGPGQTQVSIWPVASNAASLLASSLGSADQGGVTICDRLNVPIDLELRGWPSHRFGDSKIAITGFSGRFPDAPSNDEFWEMLCAGRDTHRTIPPDRFDWEAHYDPAGKEKNKSRVKYGCFINEPGLFDARFFNLSPREAENTDPAQRLAIMTAYEALEMSGFVTDRTPSTQRDRVGVCFGTTSDDWREVNSGQDVDTYFIPGGNRAFVPGRISYFFRFSGPSISFDTACSSSFAAIHSACNFLWRGDCDTVVAGGTNVLTSPDNFVGLDRGHFLSTTGNCNPFDIDASGYCRADAVGSVVLKRLEDAVADHDPIFGVIAGANTNHCGQTVSITRPHAGDQVALFKRILRQSNTKAEDVSYVEMHGTGTQAGDATEMQSVLEAFVPAGRRSLTHPLNLGAVKANIGHAESASGVSALIKVLMMMQNSKIPPHVGIKTKINPNYPVDLPERNVRIHLKAASWKRSDCLSGKRVSFVSNFSAAGGNSALLLEDPPLAQETEMDKIVRPLHAVAVSAKSTTSLEKNIAKLVQHLQQNPETSLAALSYTTTARRAHHKFRVMSVGCDVQAIVVDLQGHIGRPDVKAISAKTPKVAWIFTGQGSLYAGAGQRFFECFSHFRSDLVHFDRVARRQGFAGFLDLVVQSDSGASLDDVDTTTAHLALVCIQMALSRLWNSWGLQPSAVVGHSLGEYAALYSAGVLTTNAVIHLVGTRARLLETHCTRDTHSMIAVKVSMEMMAPLLTATRCEVACINSPNALVLSGTKEDIQALSRDCQAHGLACKVLDIPYAFHSAQVNPIMTAFKAAARGVTFSVPKVPYMSPLLGETISTGGILNGEYLADACRGVVNLKGVLENARQSGSLSQDTIWLELGSHPACSNMVKDTLGSLVTSLACMRKDVDPWKTSLETIRSLYLQGVGIDFNEFHRDFAGSHTVIPLPLYQWELKNYWIDYRGNFCILKGDGIQATTAPLALEAPRSLSSSVHRILESHDAINASTLLTESDIHDPRLAPVLSGHRVNGVSLCPSSLYIDMALTITRHMLTSSGRLNDRTGLDCGTMKVDKSLIAKPESASQLLHTSATADWLRGEVTFAFYSVDAQSQQKLADHATCTVVVTDQQHWIEDWKRSTYLIQSRIDSLHQAVNGGKAHKLKRGLAYKLFAALVDYSTEYQGMQEVVLDSDTLEASAQVKFQAGDAGFYQSPCWIDSCGHIAGFIMNGNDNTQSKDQVFINHGWDAARLARPLQHGKTYCTYNRMQQVAPGGTLYAGDTYILEDGVIIGVFEGVKFQGVPRRMIEMVLPNPERAAKSAAAPKPALHAPKPRAAGPGAASKGGFDQTTSKLVKADDSTTIASNAGTASPATTTADILIIVAQETGIDVADLDINSPLPDLGIDSLLTLTISGRLKEELGMDAAMTEDTTLHDLIALAAGPRPASPSSAGTKTPATSTSQGTTDTDLSSIDDDESTTDVLQVVRAVIARETGVPLEDLHPHSSLDELGVDSLLALTMISALSETLGKSLPPTMFADSETIWDVENILGMNGYINSSITETTIEHSANTHVPQSSQAEAAQLAVLQPPHASSVCLQGNAKTASSKFFLFPDGAGSAVSYAQLPDVSPTVVVYGLSCPFMREPERLTCSLEEYVAKFLVEVRRRQPKGPYYLGGWSAGGILAFEAAKQLAKMGETTKQLVLLDSPDPVGLQNPPARMYDFLEGLDLFGMEGKSAPKWLRPHMTAFIRMLDRYKARAFDGPAPSTRLIYARDGLCKHPGDPRPETRPDDPREMLWLLNNRTDFTGGGWRLLIGRENLRVDVVDDANHYTVLSSPRATTKVSDLIASACGWASSR